MSAYPSTPSLAPLLQGPLQPIPASGGFTANPPRINMSLLDMPALKSFGMLVTGMEGGYPGSPTSPESRAIPPQSAQNRRGLGAPVIAVIGKPEEVVQTEAGMASATAPTKVPEARYAYYRRCQKFLRNGEQCKAPAMKGEAICHQHAQQADNQRRRDQQRREFLSRPGVGFGSFNAIQVALSELANSLFMGTIDHKVAGRLMMDIQNAIRLQKMLARASTPASQHRTGRGPGAQRLGALAKKPVRGNRKDQEVNSGQKPERCVPAAGVVTRIAASTAQSSRSESPWSRCGCRSPGWSDRRSTGSCSSYGR